MGIFMAFSGFFNGRLLAVLLLAYAAVVIADLFKRHLLSNTVIYWLTMLAAPFAAVTAIAAPVTELISEAAASINEKMSWIKIILLFIGGFVLLLLAVVIYVRGHISPMPKNSEKYGENKKYFAAKRLIKTGMAGSVIYFLPFAVMSAEMLLYISVGTSVAADIVEEFGFMGLLEMVLVVLLVLLIPIVNIFAICALFFLGTEFAVWGVTALVIWLVNILIANGCIRYILTTDKTKAQKAWRIFLALIPAVNVVYGIRCWVKINKALKSNY